MHTHSEKLLQKLSAQAQQIRIDVLNMVYSRQSGHLGGAFSCAEILACLYFHHLKIDPAQPNWAERDRFLFSKGHACAALYAAMARRGFFSPDELAGFRRIDSRLQGHPDPLKLPGIEIPAGPLGHGIAVGAGMALALREDVCKPSAMPAPSSRASRSNVYVLIGDGEINAGIIWEGAMTAAHYKLGNLAVLLDYNGIQQTGATAQVMNTEPVMDKWLSFGWHVQEIHGHNVRSILDALDRAGDVHARPSIIIARTTKGKGVGFMEYDHRWHGRPPNAEQYQQALAELEEGLARWKS